MVELLVDGGIQPFALVGELLCIVGATKQFCHLYHVGKAFANEAVVGVYHRFSAHINVFGCKPVAEEPHPFLGIGPRLEKFVLAVLLDKSEP